MEVVKETSRDLLHGHLVVGVTSQPLTVGSYSLARGVLLRAPGTLDPTSNTATVYVGGKAVTADLDGGTGGMPIPPGQAVFIPIEDPSLLYVVSTDAGQDLAWMAM